MYGCVNSEDVRGVALKVGYCSVLFTVQYVFLEQYIQYQTELCPPLPLNPKKL